MNKKIFLIVFSLLISFSYINLLNAENYKSAGYGFTSYPTQLSETIRTLNRLPEVQRILQQLRNSGSIRIVLDANGPFQAYWDGPSRTIGVNPDENLSKGAYISSILFEMHNALSNKQLAHLTSLALRGYINKDQYVRDIEKLEHENAIMTCEILNKGIRNKIFPKDAEWPIFKNFEDHYQVQQLTGHSEQIALSYDRMRQGHRKEIYKGTMTDFPKLSKQEKNDYIRYLSIKQELESNNRDEVAKASKLLQKEHIKLQKESLPKSSHWMFEKVFKGHPVYETMISKKT